MSTDVKPWNPQDVASAIRERIRLEFMAAIPDEQFTAMIKAEIAAFTQPQDSRYTRDEYRSIMQDVVRKHLTEIVTTECRTLLHSAEWSAIWGQNGETASVAVSKLVAERGSEIVSAVLANMLQNAINLMKQKQY